MSDNEALDRYIEKIATLHNVDARVLKEVLQCHALDSMSYAEFIRTCIRVCSVMMQK